ncbi:hypothetical protein [Actinocorallia sp. A-T 12471]|uniref:hypothetical protein n=1 Tax=Actinocorallia sp. A-T 12471 TaxID=3089813 RepID=UPI0029CBB9EB|nr:hypothetical protein [Actinocorallia sp. A-T 12471]MDX6743698.1 hypothetical protein [Actinocorallia sp. A-T 12471]
MAFGKIDCPSKEITVRVTNDGADSQGYSITRNGSVVLADRLGAAASRSSEIALAEDKNVIVRVTQDGETVKSRTYKLNCVKGGAAPASEKPERLPETGSGTGTLVARLATGAASIITGAIILWWGGLWPRRREGMFGSSDRG